MAVKKLWPSGVAGSKTTGSFEAEVRKVRHKNIVKLACSITNRNSVSRLAACL